MDMDFLTVSLRDGKLTAVITGSVSKIIEFEECKDFKKGILDAVEQLFNEEENWIWKKEDLKLCDVIETREGDLYILLKGDFGGSELAFMDVKIGCFFSFDSCDNNLYDRLGCGEYDIMKVKHFDYSGDAFRALGMIEKHKKQEIDWDWIRPEPYNAKIVCIKGQTPHFTKGRIYEVNNGVLYGNENSEFDCNAKNIDEINEYLGSKFIELVEV